MMKGGTVVIAVTETGEGQTIALIMTMIDDGMNIIAVIQIPTEVVTGRSVDVDPIIVEAQTVAAVKMTTGDVPKSIRRTRRRKRRSIITVIDEMKKIMEVAMMTVVVTRDVTVVGTKINMTTTIMIVGTRTGDILRLPPRTVIVIMMIMTVVVIADCYTST